MDDNEKYNKAIKIESTETFKYGMNTNVGNAFVYGKLEAIDTVTYPEIGGKYLSVEKVKERYTMHTRTVTSKVGKVTTTRVETYWTWDNISSENLQSKKVKFCNMNFNSLQFNIPSREYIDTIKESSNIRYKYYGYPAKSEGTIFANLSNKNIDKDGVSFYKDMTTEETIDYLESGFSLVLFWILWVVFIIATVFGFYYLDNKWLDN